MFETLRYIIYEACILGRLPADVLGAPGALLPSGLLDPLVGLDGAGAGLAAGVLPLFSLAALMTSFLGTACSQFEELESLGAKLKLKLRAQFEELESLGAKLKLKLRALPSGDGDGDGDGDGAGVAGATAAGVTAPLVLGATLLPPLAIAHTWPEVFLPAMEAAGTFGNPLLFGVIPAVAAWSLRGYGSGDRGRGSDAGESADGGGEGGHMVPGGRWTLGAIGGLSSAMIVDAAASAATGVGDAVAAAAVAAPPL